VLTLSLKTFKGEAMNNSNFGSIVAVGLVAMLLIYLSTVLGLPHHIEKGVVLTCISVVLFLVAGAVFQSSWQVAIVPGVIAIVLLVLAVNAFGTSDIAKTTELLPTISYTLLS
jgi:amino acid transporter